MAKEKNSNFVPPQDMWEVNANLNFDLPLAEDDPRYVDSEKGRGKFSYNEMYRTLGIDVKQGELRAPREKSYNLFCGHRGCGKSTELRRLAMDYRRFLNMEDYDILYKIDRGEIADGNSQQIRRLLYNLAILEYNSGWRRAHPIIRHLEGYKKR
ncbi:MAG: hypothetical protein NT166_13650 [Candidatus Aminicenantes bacterium]|nr:hypothetical protein [Candidatus Aminicenantes bacterium]